jgi:hypothetical protein
MEVSAATLVVDSSFNQDVYGTTNAGGSQTTYAFWTSGNGKVDPGHTGFANLPIALSGTPVQFTSGGYITLMPAGSTISDATLNLSLNMFSPTVTGTLVPGDSGFYAPVFGVAAGSPLTYTVTISSGSVSYTTAVPATSFSIDLFAHGFATQIRNGQPLSITFNLTENLTANYSTYDGSHKQAGGETFNMLDSRRIGGSGSTMTLTFEPPTPVPEPFTTALVGLGLALIGAARWKRRR